MQFSKRPFITWLVTNALVATGSFWAYKVGIANMIWEADHTKLTLLAYVLFWLVSWHIGRVCRDIESYDGDSTHAYEVLKMKTNVGFFWGQICLSVGLIGSLIGFIGMMLVAFGDVNLTADAAALPSMLAGIGKNYGTALYVTLIGVMAGVVMQVQSFAADYALDMKHHALD